MTPGAGILLALMLILAGGCLSILTLSTMRAAQPVILSILAFLAMVGVFFLFGLVAGNIRLRERVGGAEWLEAAADNLDHGFLLTARDGAPLVANGDFRQLVGVDDAGALGRLEDAFAGEPQAAECLFRLMRAAERGEVRAEEFRLRDSEGRDRSGRWLRLSVRPLAAKQLAGHNDDLILWQVVDISRDKAREAEAVRGLETALAAYEKMPVGLLTVAGDGRVTGLNGALGGWLGLAPDTLRKRTLKLDDIAAGAGEALLRSTLKRANGAPVRLDLDLVREDGVGIPVELMAIEVVEGAQAGEITALVLSRGHAMSGASVEADARYARLFHSSPFGIATLGEDGRILTANGAFARMFSEPGQADAGSIGTLVGSTGDQEARRAVDHAMAEARLGRASLAPIEISFGPNKEFTRRLYISPIAQQVRQGEAAMLYVIDATEQKALELKYAQSTKMEAVGKLAGGIAHDFNNVLTAIIGFSDLLLQMHRPTDAAYADILNIKKEANRAARLVRQLLAFSRRQTLQPEVLELGEVLTDLSALLNRLLGEKVDLKIVTGRDLWFVKADRTQFDQVIINLAVNAKDAMADGGQLVVRAKNISERDSLKLRSQSVLPGEYVCVEVEDTGTGMSAEIMSKIFEPFFSTKEVGKGTGLGLSTVYGIVKQTGGYVFPESVPGKGTIFRVYLPRHIPESQEEVASAREPKKERPRDLTGTGRVLLVEDEDSVRSFAVRALKRQGYEVLEATTGLEALELVAADEGEIDIVVSDVVMPEMDGPTMITELRKTRPDLKVIFVSGYPDDRFKTGLDAGAHFAFLPKPFTLPQLAAKVKEELGS